MARPAIAKRGCGVAVHVCEGCGRTHETYFVHGDTHRPRLMNCAECDTIYYYDEEAEHYVRPLSDQLSGEQCVTCSTPLSQCLTRYRPATRECPQCGGRLKRTEVLPHEYREFVDLYGE